MRGISKEELRRLRDHYFSLGINLVIDINNLIEQCKELNPWLPIEDAPKNREILVYAPPHDGLDALKRICKWHESAGFCIDEFRTVTHYQELPDDPKD